MSRLFSEGSQNAEQLRRLVIYRTKDLGLTRPTDEVLDLVVMLVNRGSTVKEIEKDMPYIFPDCNKRIDDFPNWLVKEAVPRVLAATGTKTSSSSGFEKTPSSTTTTSATTTNPKVDQKNISKDSSTSSKSRRSKRRSRNESIISRPSEKDVAEVESITSSQSKRRKRGNSYEGLCQAEKAKKKQRLVDDTKREITPSNEKHVNKKRELETKSLKNQRFSAREQHRVEFEEEKDRTIFKKELSRGIKEVVNSAQGKSHPSRTFLSKKKESSGSLYLKLESDTSVPVSYHLSKPQEALSPAPQLPSSSLLEAEPLRASKHRHHSERVDLPTKIVPRPPLSSSSVSKQAPSTSFKDRDERKRPSHEITKETESRSSHQHPISGEHYHHPSYQNSPTKKKEKVRHRSRSVSRSSPPHRMLREGESRVSESLRKCSSEHRSDEKRRTTRSRRKTSSERYRPREEEKYKTEAGGSQTSPSECEALYYQRVEGFEGPMAFRNPSRSQERQRYSHARSGRSPSPRSYYYRHSSCGGPHQRSYDRHRRSSASPPSMQSYPAVHSNKLGYSENVHELSHRYWSEQAQPTHQLPPPPRPHLSDLHHPEQRAYPSSSYPGEPTLRSHYDQRRYSLLPPSLRPPPPPPPSSANYSSRYCDIASQPHEHPRPPPHPHHPIPPARYSISHPLPQPPPRPSGSNRPGGDGGRLQFPYHASGAPLGPPPRPSNGAVGSSGGGVGVGGGPPFRYADQYEYKHMTSDSYYSPSYPSQILSSTTSYLQPSASRYSHSTGQAAVHHYHDHPSHLPLPSLNHPLPPYPHHLPPPPHPHSSTSASALPPTPSFATHGLPHAPIITASHRYHREKQHPVPVYVHQSSSTGFSNLGGAVNGNRSVGGYKGTSFVTTDQILYIPSALPKSKMDQRETKSFAFTPSIPSGKSLTKETQFGTPSSQQGVLTTMCASAALTPSTLSLPSASPVDSTATAPTFPMDQPRPVPEYYKVFSANPSGQYQYKFDLQNDFLSRAEAYDDDYCVLHLAEKFTGPPAECLLPNPTYRNDSRGNPTCSITCTPYDGNDVPSRCRHWPFCYFGTSTRQPCKFWHPNLVCKKYPQCPQDDEHCPYIHPKYFAAVNNPESNLYKMTLDFPIATDAALSETDIVPTELKVMSSIDAFSVPEHSSGSQKSAVPGHSVQVIAATCLTPNNTSSVFPAPVSGTASSAKAASGFATLPCKFGIRCTRKDCPFTHPHVSERFTHQISAETQGTEKIPTGHGWEKQSAPDWIELEELDVYADHLWQESPAGI